MDCGNCCGSGSGGGGGNSNAISFEGQNFSYDSFSRLVIDAPTTVFTTVVEFTPQNQILNYRSTGTGRVFFDMSQTLIELSVNDVSGRAIRQSQEYLLYLPGKSQIAHITFTPHYKGTFDNSVAIRAGLFDDYRDKNTLTSINPGNALGQEVNQKSMGHFFELSGNQWFVVERYNSINNKLNVSRIPQSQWNRDTLNGNILTSPSGFVLPSNPTTGLLGFIDRQWLGVGVVRMGFFFNAKPVICHIFQNRDIGYPYTHLAKLPLRWEIEKVPGGSVSSPTMAAICGAVYVGGSYVPFGTLFSIPADLTLTQIPIDAAVVRPVLLIRLQQKYCRATLKIKGLELINTNTNNADGAFQVAKNPVITGPAYTWLPHPDPRSMIEYVILTNAKSYSITGGLISRAGFFTARAQIQDDLSVEELLTAPSYCSDIYGNPDVFCLAVGGLKATGGDITVAVNARWLEIV